MNDWELLQEYVRSRSETAFAQLVERHVRWVHSVCKRQVRDAHLAEDVTQAVFLLLSQKAARLSTDTSITGWLFRTAQLTSSNVMQSQRRRIRRETRAAAERPETAAEPAGQNESALVEAIDAGLARLRSVDRDLLVLRFYGNKTAAEAAAELGISVEAAQKRFTRAIDALRQAVAQQGVAVPAVGAGAALMSAMQSGSTGAMPQALASWLSAGASPAQVSTAAAAIAKSGALKSATALTLAAMGVIAIAIGVVAVSRRPSAPRPLPAPATPSASAPAAAAPQLVALTLQSLSLNTPQIFGASISPDGRFAASRTFGEITRWDLNSAQPIGNPLPTQMGSVSVATGDNGVVAAVDMRDLLVFDSAAATTPRRIQLPRLGVMHFSIALSPDGRLVALGGSDGIIRILDIADGHEIRAFPTRRTIVWTILFSPDGQTLLSGGRDEPDIVLSDVATGAEIHRFDSQAWKEFELRFSPDGRSALSFNRNVEDPRNPKDGDGAVRVWDLATGSQRQLLQTPRYSVSAAIFTPDGQHVAAFSFDQVIVWDLTTGQPVAHIPVPGPRCISLAGAFSRDGRRLLIGGTRTRPSFDLIDLKDSLTRLPAGN